MPRNKYQTLSGEREIQEIRNVTMSCDGMKFMNLVLLKQNIYNHFHVVMFSYAA
jgi:hypothetical protein